VGGGQSAGDIASGTVASGRRKGNGGSLGGDGLGSRALNGSLLTNGVSIGASGLGDGIGVRVGSIRSLVTLSGLGVTSRSSSKRDDVGGGLGSVATRAVEESTSRAAVGLANLGLGGSGEGDGKSGSKADVEDITNLDVKVNSETKSKGNDLVDGDSTVVGGDEGSSVLEEADPDSNLGTSLDLKDRDVKLGLKVDLGSETKAKLKSNLSRKVDISSNTNGESLGDEAIKGNINNLLGQERNLNESLLAESKVDTSRKVNSSVNSDNKVKSKSSTGLSLKKTRDLEVKSGRSEEFNGLVDGGGSGDVNLDVGLDTAETNADARLLEEALDELELGVSRDLSLGEVKTEVHSSRGAGSRGCNALEENVVLPAVGQAARRRHHAALVLAEAAQRLGEALDGGLNLLGGHVNILGVLQVGTFTKRHINVEAKTKSDATGSGEKVRRGLGNSHKTSQGGKQAGEMHSEKLLIK
jgi:hypothetical protein